MKNLKQFGLLESVDGDALRIVEPLGYLEFLKLQSESRFVLTDSGGIQEETTYLDIPCITIRETTERPERLTSAAISSPVPIPIKLLRPRVEF